jgi:hypothetical protein
MERGVRWQWLDPNLDFRLLHVKEQQSKFPTTGGAYWAAVMLLLLLLLLVGCWRAKDTEEMMRWRTTHCPLCSTVRRLDAAVALRDVGAVGDLQGISQSETRSSTPLISSCLMMSSLIRTRICSLCAQTDGGPGIHVVRTVHRPSVGITLIVPLEMIATTGAHLGSPFAYPFTFHSPFGG